MNNKQYYYSSPEKGSFYRDFLTKQLTERQTTQELYDAHIEIAQNSAMNNEKIMREDIEPNLERDLRSSKEIHNKCINSEIYCRDLYNCLCNNRFFYKDKEWTCSWRYAGGIIADIIEKGDYIDWYASGHEGQVTDEVRLDLIKLGWIVTPYSDDLI